MNISSVLQPQCIRKFESGISYLDSCQDRPIIVCLHGIQGSSDSFRHLFSSNLSSSNRLIVPDLPGFGSSHMPAFGDYSLISQSKKLIGFLDSIAVEKFFLYGHSVGGMIAALMIPQLKGRVLGVVCSEGNMTLNDCGESLRVYGMEFQEFQSIRYPELEANNIKIDAKGFYDTCRDIVNCCERQDVKKVLESAICPVLFLKGERSHFQSTVSGENVRFTVIPGVDHFTLSKDPVSLNEIKKFVASD